MSSRFNNTVARYNGADIMITDIKKLEQDYNTFKQTESSTLSTIADPDPNLTGSDAINRNKCLEYASNILDTGYEIQQIYGANISSSSSWLARTTINVNKYIPVAIDGITLSDGSTSKPKFSDLRLPWSMFQKFSESSERTNILKKSSEEIFDDDFLKTRTKQTLTTTYDKVISDVNIKTKKVLGTEMVKSITTKKTRVVTDVIVDEVETSSSPITPSADEFAGTVSLSYDSESAIGVCNDAEKVLNLINAEPIDVNEFSIEYYTIHNFTKTVTYTNKSDAEALYNKINDKYVTFVNADSYCFCYVTADIEKEKVGVKSTFADNYSSACNEVKQYVYDYSDYEDIYWDYNYKVIAQFSIINYSYNNVTVDLQCKIAINETCAINKCNQIINKLIEKLNLCKYYMNNTYKKIEDGGEYDNHINKLFNTNTTNIEVCKTTLAYIINNIKTFLDGRKNTLYDVSKNTSNANNFINSIKARLDKDHGTLMMAYGNILSLDSSYKLLNLSKKLISTDGLVVSPVYFGSDDKGFANINENVYYIDIDSKYSSYFSKGYYVGDTVYIVNSNFKEGVYKIQRISTIEMDEANTNAKVDGVKDLASAVTKKVSITRLYFNKNIDNDFKDDEKTTYIVKLL